MKKKTIIEIDYYEFEQMVNEAYGIKDYSFPATEECGNDSSHTFSPTEKEELDEYDIEHLNELRAGKHPSYINHTIFQDLVNRGILEPGEYIVEVCW